MACRVDPRRKNSVVLFLNILEGMIALRLVIKKLITAATKTTAPAIIMPYEAGVSNP